MKCWETLPCYPLEDLSLSSSYTRVVRNWAFPCDSHHCPIWNYILGTQHWGCAGINLAAAGKHFAWFASASCYQMPEMETFTGNQRIQWYETVYLIIPDFTFSHPSPFLVKEINMGSWGQICVCMQVSLSCYFSIRDAYDFPQCYVQILASQDLHTLEIWGFLCKKGRLYIKMQLFLWGFSKSELWFYRNHYNLPNFCNMSN